MSFVVIESNGKFLLVQEASPKNKGKWFLPGGKAEKGESPEKAAKRETLEEAGCKIKLKGIFGVAYHHKTLQREKLHVYYSARALTKKIKKKPDKDSLCAAWFTYSEIKKLVVRDGLINILGRYRKNSTKLLPVAGFIFPAG